MMDWADKQAQELRVRVRERWTNNRGGGFTLSAEEANELIAEALRAAEKRGPEWRAIEEMVCDGRPVAFLSPAGPFIGPAEKPQELSAKEKADIVRQFGSWPNQKYVAMYYCNLPRDLPPPPEDAHKIKE